MTAETVEGEWSGPVYLNSSGFDPSLFHDADGRKWLVNMQWRHLSARAGGEPVHPAFGGILLQEYDPAARRLTGPIRNIFAGSDLGFVEGPNLFRRGGWAYLMTAEGGAGYDHAVTLAPARDLAGPYELHPEVHVLTSRGGPEAPPARRTRPNRGETYLGPSVQPPPPRPAPQPHGPGDRAAKARLGRGRLAAPRLGGRFPALDVPAPRPAEPAPPRRRKRRFTGPRLPPEFQWLRTPDPSRLFTLTGEALRLWGRESLGAWFGQSLVARRQEHFAYRAETEPAFNRDTQQQAAGLVACYNRHKLHFVAVTYDAALGRVLTILSCPGD